MGDKERRSRRSPLLIGFLAVLAAIAGLGAWAERSGWLYVYAPTLAPPPLDASGSGDLIKVRDGDTMVIRYHDLELALRLRCVDTEESVHPDKTRNTDLGRETSTWAKDYLSNVDIRVEFLRKSWKIDTDHHGRAIAFLWIDRGEPGPSADDELYNETLIRKGYSLYYTEFGNAGPYHGRFLKAEAQARADGLGKWAGQSLKLSEE